MIQHIDPFHCTHSDLSKQEKKSKSKFTTDYNKYSIYYYHIVRTLTAGWAYMFQYEGVQHDHYQLTKLEVWGKWVMKSVVFHKSAFFIRISACLFFWLPIKWSHSKCAYFKSNAKCSWLINLNLKFSNKCCGIKRLPPNCCAVEV